MVKYNEKALSAYCAAIAGLNDLLDITTEKEDEKKEFVDYVYNVIKLDCDKMDAIYEDYIKSLVGAYGLEALLNRHLLESCGVMNGRQLYVLKERE